MVAALRRRASIFGRAAPISGVVARQWSSLPCVDSVIGRVVASSSKFCHEKASAPWRHPGVTPLENSVPDATLAPAPVPQTERLGSLDLLRGFAVLGILVMNIQSFAMVDPTYSNPTVSGDLAGVNFAVWAASHVLADSKFMALFSMLFGAGMVLFCRRVEQRGGRPARTHARRTFFLLLFGILHAYLLWSGDILVWYSFSAWIAYLFWRVRPGWLLFWALLLFGVGTGIYAFSQLTIPYWPKEAIDGYAVYWDPPPELLQQRLEAYRGGWLAQMSDRVPTSSTMHTLVYITYGLWRTLGMMLLGMAFMKWRILSAERSDRFYVVWSTVGLMVGLPVIGYGAYQNFAHGWAMKYSMFAGTLPNYWGSILVAIAYVSVIMLVYKNGKLRGFQRLLAPVGRMAFTSYILQTLLCTTIFFGHGFGLYGRVPRFGQALVVVGVWAVVVAFANGWLARHRYGPLEWLWRSLTYGARQPLRQR